MSISLSIISEKIAKNKTPKIPKVLEYDVIDGQPYYYKNYKSVLNKRKTLESIMGYSSLQIFLLKFLGEFLQAQLKKDYWVLYGEMGLHLSHNNNFSIDLMIYERDKLSLETLQDKYFQIVPNVVIEIDTKADLANEHEFEYYFKKTQKLLDFGVNQVVWIYTKNQKIIISQQNKAQWFITNWSDTVEILGISVCLKILLEAEGIEVAQKK